MIPERGHPLVEPFVDAPRVAIVPEEVEAHPLRPVEAADIGEGPVDRVCEVVGEHERRRERRDQLLEFDAPAKPRLGLAAARDVPADADEDGAVPPDACDHSDFEVAGRAFGRGDGKLFLPFAHARFAKKPFDGCVSLGMNDAFEASSPERRAIRADEAVHRLVRVQDASRAVQDEHAIPDRMDERHDVRLHHAQRRSHVPERGDVHSHSGQARRPSVGVPRNGTPGRDDPAEASAGKHHAVTATKAPFRPLGDGVEASEYFCLILRGNDREEAVQFAFEAVCIPADNALRLLGKTDPPVGKTAFPEKSRIGLPELPNDLLRFLSVHSHHRISSGAENIARTRPEDSAEPSIYRTCRIHSRLI